MFGGRTFGGVVFGGRRGGVTPETITEEFDIICVSTQSMAEVVLETVDTGPSCPEFVETIGFATFEMAERAFVVEEVEPPPPVFNPGVEPILVQGSFGVKEKPRIIYDDITNVNINKPDMLEEVIIYEKIVVERIKEVVVEQTISRLEDNPVVQVREKPEQKIISLESPEPDLEIIEIKTVDNKKMIRMAEDSAFFEGRF